MFKIKTMNTISGQGIGVLEKRGCEVGADIAVGVGAVGIALGIVTQSDSYAALSECARVGDESRGVV